MRARGVVGAVTGLLLLAGCERLEGVVSGGESTAGPRVARVVVFVPDSGRSGAAAEAVTQAVRLALDDVAAHDWTVEVDHVTDGGSDGSTAAAARRVADDSDVIGVVGGLSTPVLRAAQPVLDEAGIPFISPADTVAEHTRGADPTTPRRPYESYFRAAVPETNAQEVAAKYAVLGLGASTVSVVEGDGPPEAASFAHHARRLGAEVIDEDADSAAAPVRYVTAGPRIAAEAAAADPASVVIGGAGVVSDAFLTMAGRTAEGTVGVVPATLEPSDGRAVPGLGDPGRYGAAAYDAGMALAATLERCLPSVRAGAARDARTGCLAELGRTGFEGRTGEFSFDRYGDRQGAFPQVFVVTDGAWTEVGRE